MSNRRPSPTRRSVRIQTTPRTFPIPSARQSISNRACSTRKSIPPYRPLNLNSEFEESSSCSSSSSSSRIPIRFAIRLTEQNSCRTSVYLRPRNPNAPRTRTITRTIPNFGIWVKALEVAHWMRQPPISRNRPPCELFSFWHLDLSLAPLETVCPSPLICEICGICGFKFRNLGLRTQPDCIAPRACDPHGANEHSEYKLEAYATLRRCGGVTGQEAGEWRQLTFQRQSNRKASSSRATA